jgi:hypothetical protein
MLLLKCDPLPVPQAVEIVPRRIQQQMKINNVLILKSCQMKAFNSLDLMVQTMLERKIPKQRKRQQRFLAEWI